MSYRVTVLGIIVSLVFIVGFCKTAGMSVWVVLAFFGIYYAISTAVTRMRAELGSPVHDLHFIGPDEMMPRIFGTRLLGPHNLTIMAYLFFFNRAYRGHPMPHILEGFKLAERTAISNRRLLIAMCIAIVIGTFASFWAFYHISYIEGARDWFAGRPFNSSSELVDITESSRRTGNCRNVYRFPDYRFPDDNADATLLVALSPRRIRYLQQLVNECILVFDLGEFSHQVDCPSARWCECTPKTYSVLPRSNLR